MADVAMKHMASNFAKLDKFKGVGFRRWQKKMHFLFFNISVVYVLTTPILKYGENATMEQIRKWNKLSHPGSLEAKYMAKDASSKKFIVSNFTNYKITHSRPVMEQYNELLGILGIFTSHKINMDKVIQVSCIIYKLPPSWKDFKHTLKHKKEELTLVELGSHVHIEESLGVQDNEKPKDNMFLVLQWSIWNANFDENRFSLVSRPRLKIPNGTEDIGGSVVLEEDDPKTFDEAMKSQDISFEKEVINKEMDAIMANNTWVLANLPPGCKPLHCKWIYQRKLKVDGTIENFKPRLVIQGFRKKSGIDYFDTYAPVARISTIRLLIALVPIHNLIIHQMDVNIAFLNGELYKEFYTNQSYGFIIPANEN
uniref:Zinc finger, CCHC-type n=1 Tax=Tanacetum cinerariifolium TaxID=118510 RepID=A0A6L2KET1_TANCI|nr:zinc finger, CCHC-type [Tanacetum cinerariifolium]